MNIFARKIGFYYMNREWAEKIFDKITSMTDKEYMERMIKCKTLMEIVYKDGTVVRFHKATDQARGYRYHLAYMEAGLSYDIYSTLVMPKMMFKEYGGGQVFVLSSAEALFHEWSDDGFCMDARDYFRMYNKEHYEKIVKQIDERIKKECEIASVNDAIGTQIKLSRLEAISKLGEWAAENPETAKCMRQYIDIDIDDEVEYIDIDEVGEALDTAFETIRGNRKLLKMDCKIVPNEPVIHRGRYAEELTQYAENGDLIIEGRDGYWYLKKELDMFYDDCK